MMPIHWHFPRQLVLVYFLAQLDIMPEVEVEVETTDRVIQKAGPEV
jgi:hypothetical protein